jgi:hypothetical protein
MHPSVRRITVILLLTVLLAPGLLQAKSPVRHLSPARVTVTTSESSLYGLVWNLLASFMGSGSTRLLKTGSQLDPAAPVPAPTSSTTTTTDTGSQLDPAGAP